MVSIIISFILSMLPTPDTIKLVFPDYFIPKYANERILLPQGLDSDKIKAYMVGYDKWNSRTDTVEPSDTARIKIREFITNSKE